MGEPPNISLLSIDLKPLSETANLLIEKLSSAVGWIVSHDSPKKSAISQYIIDIQNDPTLDPLVKAALVTNAQKIIREYCNQKDIISFAIHDLHGASNSSINQLDDDWILSFMDKARLVSNKDLQALWGKILSQECKEPHSVPKHLLTILESVDSYLATAFTKIKSHSIRILDDKPRFFSIIHFDSDSKYFNAKGLNLDVLTDLDAIGLISFNISSRYTITTDVVHCPFQYGNQLFSIDEDGYPDLEAGNVQLTRAGERLCEIIEAPELTDFLVHCLPDIGVKYRTVTDLSNSTSTK